MAPQNFVMISKTFADGISLEKEGPKLTKEFTNELVLDNERSYVTAANFVKKFVPKHFVTTLKVGEELTYFEKVFYERRTVMQKFSETINVFSRDKVNQYCSKIIYEPNATNKRYIAGIELLPAQKFVVTQTELINVNGESVATKFREKIALNGDMNGYALINGVA